MKQNSILNKLLNIQKELKVPKGQMNTFGNYPYRSCEDIMEAAKPLCVAQKALLTVSDLMQECSGRVYVVANAVIQCVETGEVISVTASAREAATKKGMDDSQITGSTSSYARKYALGGLFALDDTRDADTMKPPKEEPNQPLRNWIEEIKTAGKLESLKAIFGEAYQSTEGPDKAKVKLEYDKRKVEIEELGGSSQAQQ